MQFLAWGETKQGDSSYLLPRGANGSIGYYHIEIWIRKLDMNILIYEYGYKLIYIIKKIFIIIKNISISVNIRFIYVCISKKKNRYKYNFITIRSVSHPFAPPSDLSWRTSFISYKYRYGTGPSTRCNRVSLTRTPGSSK